MKFFQRLFTAIAVILLVAIPAFAQTTANLTGTVIQEGSPLPGVTVTISSPSLQGVRTTYTDVNGNYSFRSIPPGSYTVKFEMDGMQTATKTVQAGLAQTARADADLQLSAVAESITVTASAPAVLETTEVQTNLQADLIEDLPVARTINGTANLAPGVNANAPGGGLTISGALGSDNLFLVNGAVTNENLRGQSHNLFIEDAIQETTVQTAGISAEYGRFTGGVVNAITKSGGNEFSGSFRDSFTNPKWTALTPVETVDRRLDTLNETYEGTLGGRILRDRLWFFAAGRYFSSDLSTTFSGSPNLSYTAGDEETRMEGKLTGQITSNHNLMLSYLDITRDQTNYCFGACAEPSNLDASRSLPNDFLVARYNGILTDKFLIEGAFTQKNFTFEGSGGDDRSLEGGTPVRDLQTGYRFGAPFFCGICDPEERNNSSYAVKGTYYLASKGLGTHNIVAGYENWAEERLSNNYQSASNFAFYTYSPQNYDLNPGENFMPVIAEGDVLAYWPILQLSKGSSFETDSLFVNDKWDLNQNLTFNLGLRFDKNNGVDASGATVSDDSQYSPRVGVMYDVRGDGRYRVNASYARYVNRIAETIGSSQSSAGSPAYFGWLYTGPEISGLPTPQAMALVFDWFNSLCDGDGNCGVNNFAALNGAEVGGVSTLIPDSLVSPSADEMSFGFGTQLGVNGFLRADFINRTWNDFFVRKTDLSTGQVSDEVGNEYDLTYIINSDELERTYDAIQLQGGYRLSERWNLGANYTWSETSGNQTGQTSGSGPIADSAGANYPEFVAFAQNNPVGPLTQDQTHKARAWVSYDLPTFLGNFNFSLLENFDSGTPYEIVAGIDSRPYVSQEIRNAYLTEPSSVNYYFSDRGAFRWDDVTSSDLAINYTLPIRRASVFFQAELLNAFDEDAQIGGDLTVLTRRQSSCLQSESGPTPGQRCLAFNPFTETPVEGTHYRLGSNFGAATTATHFQSPRTYRFSAGVRF